MKSIKRYLVILLLLAVTLPLIAIASSSNVSATVAPTPTATPTPTEIQSFAPFYAPVFGISIAPNADPIGVYSVYANPDYRLWSAAPTTGTVRVTIYGTDGVTPYANAIIAYYDAAIDDWNYQNHVASDGTFTFHNVPVGSFDYAAYNPGFSHLISNVGSATVTGGQTANVQIVAFQM
jgi:hypothetical protein